MHRQSQEMVKRSLLFVSQMSHNLDLLEPGEKVVVFNLSEIFAQLREIKPDQLEGVMYDGRVLIFPAIVK